MVKYIGFTMIGIGLIALFGAAFLGANSTEGATANVIASNSHAFSYVEGFLFSIATASLIMGAVFLKHSRRS